MGCGASAPVAEVKTMRARPTAQELEERARAAEDSALVTARWRQLARNDAAALEARRLDGEGQLRLCEPGAFVTSAARDKFQRAVGGIAAVALYEGCADTWVEPPRNESGERCQEWCCGKCSQLNQFPVAPRSCSACGSLRGDLVEAPEIPRRRAQLAAEREANLRGQVADLMVVVVATKPAAIRSRARRRLLAAADATLKWLPGLAPLGAADVQSMCARFGDHLAAARVELLAGGPGRQKRAAVHTPATLGG
jgi:hypothetical protein